MARTQRRARISSRLKPVLMELREQFQALYHDRLAQMILYGSSARGDAEPHSDIDVLVVLKGHVDSGEEISRTGEIVADISLRFGEVISCLFMDEERFAHRNGPLLRNVRKEGLAV